MDGGLIAHGSKIFSEYLTPTRLKDFRLFLAENLMVGGKKIFLEDPSKKFFTPTRLKTIRWVNFYKKKKKTELNPNEKKRRHRQ